MTGQIADVGGDGSLGGESYGLSLSFILKCKHRFSV